MIDTFKVLTKRLSSYLKSHWDFSDYPIRTWRNPNAGENKVAFGAGIINWSLMVGHGETPEKAIQALKHSFNLFKENNPNLPRPGSHVPIKYASTEQIDKYKEIAIDFFRRVLNQDYSKGFYSDEARLWPIEGSKEEQAIKIKEEIIRRTSVVYGIDITCIYDEPLCKIFEKIKNKKED